MRAEEWRELLELRRWEEQWCRRQGAGCRRREARGSSAEAEERVGRHRCQEARSGLWCSLVTFGEQSHCASIQIPFLHEMVMAGGE